MEQMFRISAMVSRKCHDYRDINTAIAIFKLAMIVITIVITTIGPFGHVNESSPTSGCLALSCWYVLIHDGWRFARLHLERRTRGRFTGNGDCSETGLFLFIFIIIILHLHHEF